MSTMKTYLTGLAAALLLCGGQALAANAPPPPDFSEDDLAPGVTITPGEDQAVTEYRLNGRLFMVKIQPVIGPAYYLVDDDGDGRLESRHGLTEELAIPRWLLLKW